MHDITIIGSRYEVGKFVAAAHASHVLQIELQRALSVCFECCGRKTVTATFFQSVEMLEYGLGFCHGYFGCFLRYGSGW